jgi:Tol biopolymer transport system component
MVSVQAGRSQLRRRAGAASFAVALLVALLTAARGEAAFPGVNGKIAFTRCDSTGCGIWTMNLDGTNEARLTPAGEEDQDPAYSSDGQKLAFERRPDGSSARIALAAPDLSGETELTTGTTSDPVIFDTAPSLSPDGKTLVFSRSSTGTFTNTIWSITSSGGEPTQLTHEAQSLNLDGNPVFSPDGKKIAFEYGRFGPLGMLSEIDLMDADGSNRVGFTPPAATALTPEGPLPATVTLSSSSPDFSPDGSKIVLAQCCDANHNSRIVIAPITDGSASIVLTSPDADHSDGSPAFSPDGTQVVFVRSVVATGTSVISSVPADGGPVTALSSPGSHDMSPVWQPAPADDVAQPPVADPRPVLPTPPATTPPATTPKQAPIAIIAAVPQIRNRKVAIKHGAASLTVNCPANAQGLCAGTLTLQARMKPHQGLKTIGKADFGVAPGASAAVKVRLSAAARTLLSGHRTLPAVAKLERSGGPASVTALRLIG